MTRFVVCLDGTWNNAVSEVERLDGAKVYRPSNVLKVARATSIVDLHGIQQVTYYDTGIGSMNRAPSGAERVMRVLDNALGGMLGAGFAINVEEAYAFLTNNWREGDELFVFGFSRGAAQARSLVQLIGCVGGFPAKADAYYVPKFYTDYLESFGKVTGTDFWVRQNKRNAAKDPPRPPLRAVVPARVRFLGVWDTVLSLGSRLRPSWATAGESTTFHVSPTPPANVDRVRHAMAIDELRHDFQVEIFTPGRGDVEQRWFAGVHSNVGGGLGEDGLANCALRWMLDEARAAGLAVDDAFLQHYKCFPQGRASQKSRGFALVDRALTPWRGFKGERDLLRHDGLTLDPSVIHRLNADPAKHHRTMDGPYRPTNLLRYLAKHPELRSQLNPDVQAAVDEAAA